MLIEPFDGINRWTIYKFDADGVDVDVNDPDYFLILSIPLFFRSTPIYNHEVINIQRV